MRYEYDLPDGTRLVVPDAWRTAFEARFASMSEDAFLERLLFVTSKYVEHRATPSKFDGIVRSEEGRGDERYDDPLHYFEPWDDGETKSMAAVAERVLYQNLRLLLMQEALDAYAAEHGTTPIRVVTPQGFGEALRNAQARDGESG